MSTISKSDNIYKEALKNLNFDHSIHENVSEAHENVKDFRCKTCNHKADSRQDLNNHVYNSHQLRAKQLKNEARKIIRVQTIKEIEGKVTELTVQGTFLKLLQEEKENITWKSIIYSMPRGILPWASRAVTDSLSTPANLARWNKIIDPCCYLCKQMGKFNKGTLHHILNNCPYMLTRYDWRHNSILSFITSILIRNNEEKAQIYADIEGHKVNSGTIPNNIIQTTQRPDLVIITKGKIVIVELTVPFESNIHGAERRKKDRYASLEYDILELGHQCEVLTIEIGSRGYITKENKERLTNIFKSFKIKKHTNILTSISKIALLTSYSIYNSRQGAEWSSIPYLRP